MDLRKYDNKCVRLTTVDGEVFDGICCYNCAEYNEHEFGCGEEALQMVCHLFYKSDIRRIESLEDHWGPYGRFSDPYGNLEETAARDGYALIDEVLTCEEDEHVLRMLRCLEKYFTPGSGCELDDREKTAESVRSAMCLTDDPGVRAEAEKLLKLWERFRAEAAGPSDG